MLQIPIDKQHPLISVDKLLSEFKEQSLEINNIENTELSFHSPLVHTSHVSWECTVKSGSMLYYVTIYWYLAFFLKWSIENIHYSITVLLLVVTIMVTTQAPLAPSLDHSSSESGTLSHPTSPPLPHPSPSRPHPLVCTSPPTLGPHPSVRTSQRLSALPGPGCPHCGYPWSLFLPRSPRNKLTQPTE